MATYFRRADRSVLIAYLLATGVQGREVHQYPPSRRCASCHDPRVAEPGRSPSARLLRAATVWPGCVGTDVCPCAQRQPYRRASAQSWRSLKSLPTMQSRRAGPSHEGILDDCRIVADRVVDNLRWPHPLPRATAVAPVVCPCPEPLVGLTANPGPPASASQSRSPAIRGVQASSRLHSLCDRSRCADHKRRGLAGPAWGSRYAGSDASLHVLTAGTLLARSAITWLRDCRSRGNDRSVRRRIGADRG